jgi:NAD(P)-dependent dehydrogenase (short-subunit alcohol dehydrogenase family)
MVTLQNKIIIITGSTRGFGYAIAQACLATGALVVITGRSQEAVDRTLNCMHEPGKTAGVIVDVREEVQVHRLADQVIQKFGRFDIWINNAGYSSAAGMILDMDPQEALEMFMSNDLGALYGTQAAMKHFLPRQAGMLVNVYGNGSFLNPATPTALYGTTKAWLTSFTRSLAKENKGSGVQILGFSPGMMTTDMLTSPRVVGEKAQKQLKNFGFVLRLLGKPAEIPARQLVRMMAGQRREFVEYRVFKPWSPLLGLLRVAWENLTNTGLRPKFELKFEESYKPEKGNGFASDG